MFVVCICSNKSSLESVSVSLIVSLNNKKPFKMVINMYRNKTTTKTQQKTAFNLNYKYKQFRTWHLKPL